MKFVWAGRGIYIASAILTEYLFIKIKPCYEYIFVLKCFKDLHIWKIKDIGYKCHYAIVVSAGFSRVTFRDHVWRLSVYMRVSLSFSHIFDSHSSVDLHFTFSTTTSSICVP